jgi:two-component system response regulator MtrA
MSDRILLVEDDEALGRQVVGHLESAGFEVRWLTNGDHALAEDPADYAMAILDLMLPGAYGLDVLKRMRGSSELPVLILSARHESHDKVRALELGADDFVTKPFWPEELIARVRTRLRRPALQRDGLIETGGLVLDVEGRSVHAGGTPVDLTRVEFDLIVALARRPGSAIERGWLVDNVLDPEREGTERTLDVHVSRLRRKLGGHAKIVQTVWGVGYRLNPDAAPPDAAHADAAS